MLLCKAIPLCMTCTVTLRKSLLSSSFLWQGMLCRIVHILCRLAQNCPASGNSLSPRFDWGDYIQTPEFACFGIGSACGTKADASLSDHQLVNTTCGRQEGQDPSHNTFPCWMVYVYFEFTISISGNRDTSRGQFSPSWDRNLKVGCLSWRSLNLRDSQKE